MEKSITVAVPIEILSLKIFIQPGRATLEIKSALIELAQNGIKLEDMVANWGNGATKPWWAIEELIAEDILQINNTMVSVSENLVSEKKSRFWFWKIRSRKKVLVSVSENLVLEKSAGFGFANIGLGKKSLGFGFRRFGIGKNVSVPG